MSSTKCVPASPLGIGLIGLLALSATPAAGETWTGADLVSGSDWTVVTPAADDSSGSPISISQRNFVTNSDGSLFVESDGTDVGDSCAGASPYAGRCIGERMFAIDLPDSCGSDTGSFSISIDYVAEGSDSTSSAAAVDNDLSIALGGTDPSDSTQILTYQITSADHGIELIEATYDGGQTPFIDSTSIIDVVFPRRGPGVGDSVTAELAVTPSTSTTLGDYWEISYSGTVNTTSYALPRSDRLYLGDVTEPAGGTVAYIISGDRYEEYTISSVTIDGCTFDVDSDGDGLLDSEDLCPADDATGNDVDGNGCSDIVDGVTTVTFDGLADGEAIETRDVDAGESPYTENGVNYNPAVDGQTYSGVFYDAGDGDIALTDDTNDGFGLPLYFSYDDGSPIVLEDLQIYDAGTLGELTLTCVNSSLGSTSGTAEIDASGSAPGSLVSNPIEGMVCETIVVDIITWTGNSSDIQLHGASFSKGAEDEDGDGVSYLNDLCPSEDATGWDDDLDGCIDDTDGDGVGDDLDICEGDDVFGDTDSDGICDDLDVCPTDDTDADADGDLICDVDDACLGDNTTGDTDGDQVCDDLDICDGNDASSDNDSDGTCDDIDNCPADANSSQADTDGDGIGDTCESDADADGVIDDDDNCPADFNEGQDDLDSDGSGDVCDDDDDGDGVDDTADNCPVVSNAAQADTDGDGIGDACDGDDDADGVYDVDDQCPGTPMGVLIDSDGCSGVQFVFHELGEPDDYSRPVRYLMRGFRLVRQASRSGLLSRRERSSVRRQIFRNFINAVWG